MPAACKAKLGAWLLLVSACVMSATDLMHTGLLLAHASGEVVDQVEDKDVRQPRAEARGLQKRQDQVAAPGPAANLEPVTLPRVAPYACLPTATGDSQALPPLIRAPPRAAVS